MKYHQFKGVVEREYKMSLKKIMHQLCVTENLSAADGAKKLGIAKEVFVFWRRYFRYEKRQILFDQKVQELTNLQSLYSAEVERKKAAKVNKSAEPNTIDAFEDVVDNLIEHYKYIHYTSEGLSLKTAKLPLYQFSKSVIDDYKKGDIIKELTVDAAEINN